MEDGTRYDATPRLDARKVAPDEFRQLVQERRPFLLVDVAGPEYLAWWRAEALQKLLGERVAFVEGDGASGARTLLEVDFGTFVEEAGKLSDRQRFAYLQTEVLPELAPEHCSHLRRNLPVALPSGEADLLGHFPRKLRPSELLLTVAGAGARTQLSCDGLGAVQWHLCISGHQRLKLLPDDRARLDALEHRTEPFGIFDEHGQPLYDICDHLVSEVDLFATEFVEQVPVSQLDSFGPDLKRWPDARLLPRALEVLLKPGEMVVVPGDWWLQSYFDEPTWSVSSQCLPEWAVEGVLNGLLARNNCEAATASGEGCSAADCVESTLAAVLGSKGRSPGHLMLAFLRQMDAQAATTVKTEGGAATAETKESKQEPKPSAECAVCGRPTTTRCGRCKALPLCGAECQRRSWPEHRKTCEKEW